MWTEEQEQRLLILLEGREGRDDFIQRSGRAIVDRFRQESEIVKWPPSRQGRETVAEIRALCHKLVGMLVPLIQEDHSGSDDPAAPNPVPSTDTAKARLEGEALEALRFAAHAVDRDEIWVDALNDLSALSVICQDVLTLENKRGHPEDRAGRGLIRMAFLEFCRRGWPVTNLNQGSLFHDTVQVLFDAGGRPLGDLKTKLENALSDLRPSPKGRKSPKGA